MKRGDYGRISIFVLVDALGWDLAQRHEFLFDILPFRNGMDTVLGFSSAAIPTLLSGEMPEGHGHWCLFRRKRFSSCFGWAWPVLFLPARLRENYRTRNAIAAVTRSIYNITGYFCLYEIPVSVLPRLDYVERRDLWSPGALGRCRNIFDALVEASVPYFSSGWRGTDEQKLESAARAVAGTPLQSCFLYLSELDAALHVHGVDSPGAREALVAAGVRIRRLLARTQEFYSEVRLFVFSDHGMTPVVESHDLQALLASKGPRKKRYSFFFDSTMARFWSRKQETRSELQNALDSVPFGRLLSEADGAELGLRFKDNGYGDLVFVMDPGHVIVPSFASSEAPKAMHGYHPCDPLSRACFLSASPQVSPPGHIRDLYSVFRSELGL